MAIPRSRVLIESADGDFRARCGALLARAGFRVSACAGPASRPDGCPLERGEQCELIRASDVVVNGLRRTLAPADVLPLVRRASALGARQRSSAVRLKDGRSVTVRGIRKSDTAAFRRFDQGLSEETRRLRYLGYMPPLDEARARWLSDVDFDSRMALVATSGERIVGDCRLVPNGAGGYEVAIALADDFQGAGLGGPLLERLLGVAADRGIDEVYADVRYDNLPMTRVLRALGFERTAWELGVMTFRLRLSE